MSLERRHVQATGRTCWSWQSLEIEIRNAPVFSEPFESSRWRSPTNEQHNLNAVRLRQVTTESTVANGQLVNAGGV
jgi:hypothetical protein